MDLSFLIVADYVNVEQSGKLNVMGIFSNIFAENFPAVHSEMYLIAQLNAGPAEYGRKCKITVKLLDEDAAHELVDLSMEREVPQGKGERVSLNQIVKLSRLLFPKSGTYQFSILVDDDEKGTLPIEVIQQHPSL